MQWFFLYSPASFSTHLLYLFFTRYYLNIKKCIIKVGDGRELKERIKIFSQVQLYERSFLYLVWELKKSKKNWGSKLSQVKDAEFQKAGAVWLCVHPLPWASPVFQDSNNDTLTEALTVFYIVSFKISLPRTYIVTFLLYV